MPLAFLGMYIVFELEYNEQWDHEIFLLLSAFAEVFLIFSDDLLELTIALKFFSTIHFIAALLSSCDLLA